MILIIFHLLKNDKKHQLEKAAPNDFKLIYESEKSIEPNEGHRIYKFIGEY